MTRTPILLYGPEQGCKQWWRRRQPKRRFRVDPARYRQAGPESRLIRLWWRNLRRRLDG